MITLTHVTERFNDYGILVSALSVVVSYDPIEREVDKVRAINVYNHHSGTSTDISHHIAEQFPAALDQMLADIDWQDIYSNQAEEIEEEVDHAN